MASTRIKDLATTATQAASDDYLAIDGATNGTRKIKPEDLGGGGASVSPYTSNPAALGSASPGSSDNYSRGDHVHPKPSASDVGAIPAPSSPSSGQYLVWNGSAWVATTPTGMSMAAKQALLDCFANVAWVGDDGQDYYDALEEALYPPSGLVSISAVYTQSGTVYDTDSLDDLKADLVVTAHYDNGTSTAVSSYTLSGTLTEGTSTITVTYGGKTTTFNVTVSAAPANYLYNWDFTQSLVDSVQGAVLSLSGDASRDSSGLHFTTANDYVVLTGLNVNGYCFEIDVAEYDRQGTAHGRLFTIYQSGVASSGFIFHNNGVWAIYSKAQSAWVDSDITSSGLDGKTVTVKLLQNENDNNKPWMYVLVNGEALVDGDMSGTTTTDAYLGSNNGQVAYNMTITGLRIYQEV